MKIINHIIIALFTMLIFSCGSGEHVEVDQLSPVAVKVSKAEIGRGANQITSSGKIEAKNSANLSTRVMGNVTKLHVEVGEKVRKGQQLLTINSADLLAKRSQVEASIVQANSALRNAEKDYERFKTLFEKESASEKELDDITTRYEIAKANLDAAQQMKREVDVQFTYTNVKAPFDGVVINTFVKAGDMANPGMPLVSVEGTGDFQSVALVSESDISKVKVDMQANVVVKSLNQEFEGKVTEVSPSAKNTGGQYIVKVDFDGAGENVLPGMFVNVQFSANGAADGNVFIPAEALIRQGQLTGIYTIGNNQTAILRWLRIGSVSGGSVEVLSGLRPDELYVVSAAGKLFNGAKITY